MIGASPLTTLRSILGRANGGNRMDEDPLYPISLYIYNLDGTYGEPVQINSDAQLNSPGTKMIVRIAMDEKRKIIMTDPGDMCVFHAEDGKVLYPPRP